LGRGGGERWDYLVGEETCVEKKVSSVGEKGWGRTGGKVSVVRKGEDKYS